MRVVQHPSPNCGPRRNWQTPSVIVIHYTAMNSADAAIDRLCDPRTEVSAHYVIARTGIVTQLVPEEVRAWHAGAGEWRGQADVNSRSIGIELDNAGGHPFPEAQMHMLETLLGNILSRWPVSPEDVIGHSDMAPGRKCDPGPRFDWTRLARQGLAARTGGDTGSQDPTPGQFRSKARRAGYTADVDDDALLAAVRLRFRPYATGPLTAADVSALQHAIPAR
ncbi:N-acetylmuramoyl-L-alanine amidase [Roseobacter sp. YSTF-M11]|uniref:N-acetylmuramoyl-L-alanine amidase n=1 Tax=Roseobacter insulae TaxID=2859783 RepID=A0A9X1JXQ5_9RHOB|nr:N-acetylmuramoyl-L-alanine amidase [Roseobacter insulae]MBW4707505.1 N-acetylmuramoyl-L-alanine amidase [Roseobacter insulae]